MIYGIRHILEDEVKYCYSDSAKRTGALIGYLRADMDTDGNGFFSNWNDYNKELKTDAFKEAFDHMINYFRGLEGNCVRTFLKNRGMLLRYCMENSSVLNEREYGVVVCDGNYSYYMRLNPNRGEYNLYCYCYKTDILNDFINALVRNEPYNVEVNDAV